MSIGIVNSYCSRRLHVQEFRRKKYFDNEVDVLKYHSGKITFSLHVHYLFTFHPPFLKFLE